MKKVGIVTFFRNNYGSVLQCYSLCTTLKKLGYSPIVFEERYKGLAKIMHNVILRAKVIGRFRGDALGKEKFLQHQKATEATNKLVSRESIDEINRFIGNYLCVLQGDLKFFKKEIKKEDYFAVITGSDQVWNCSKGFLNDFYFLSFCPIDKKVCFAPSIGNTNFDKKTIDDFKERIKEFKYLSCREKEGSSFIERLLVDKECQTLLDPVFMLSKSDLQELYNSSSLSQNGHIFIHFLNEPSQAVLEYLVEKIGKEANSTIIVFGNQYESLSVLQSYVFISGSPSDYVKLINNSSLVFTDSFHTVAFSILQGKEFFVFERNYLHNSAQSSRIINVLEIFGYSDRLIRTNESKKASFSKIHRIDDVLEKENSKQISFLERALAFNGCKN